MLSSANTPIVELETVPKTQATSRVRGGRLTKGAFLVLAWCALVHAFNVFISLNKATTTNVIYQRLYEPSEYGYLAAAFSQSFGYLHYSLAGLVAELWWTRYKTMMFGTILIAIGSMVLIPATVLFPDKIADSDAEVIEQSVISAGPMIVGLLVFQCGRALFEANAIQFGLDQLAFEPTVILCSFIHWYYWSAHFYLLPSVLEVVAPLWTQASAQIVLAAIAVLVLSLCRGQVNKEPPRHLNPIRQIYRCLSFARTHRVPVHRSAFTYDGGETPPSRLDLAKSRYGGPYSTEEVEDVKSFGRILAIMLSAFGFLLLNTFNYTPEKFEPFRYLTRYGSVDWYVFLQSVACDAVVIAYIPFYQLVIVRHFPSLVPSIFKRIGMGLFLCVASLAINTALSSYTHVRIAALYPDCSSYFNGSTSPQTFIFEQDGFVLHFHFASQFLDGLASVLVFLTMLEFIVAQSPVTMQGFLIGLWYTLQAFGIALNAALLTTYVVGGCQYWPDVAKTTLAAVSLATFLAATRRYAYRRREEVSNINVQSIIEEYTERQLCSKPDDIEYVAAHSTFTS